MPKIQIILGHFTIPCMERNRINKGPTATTFQMQICCHLVNAASFKHPLSIYTVQGTTFVSLKIKIRALYSGIISTQHQQKNTLRLSLKKKKKA